MPTIVTQPDERLIQRRVCVCPIPIDSVTNASYGTFVYNGGTGNDKLSSFNMTVDGVEYIKTITYTGDNITAISTWSVV